MRDDKDWMDLLDVRTCLECLVGVKFAGNPSFRAFPGECRGERMVTVTDLIRVDVFDCAESAEGIACVV
jgi:hypothetical protein